MVSAVPPLLVPVGGFTVAMVGAAGVTYVNVLIRVPVPPGVVTVTVCAEPAAPAGVTAVTRVESTTTTLVAGLPPTVTALALVRFAPLMVIGVPPKVEPDVGLTLEIVGARMMYVNAPGAVTFPPPVVTVTSCAPAVPAGVCAVMEVALTTTTLTAAAPPTCTVAPAIKLVPVMVMGVPPPAEPEVGLTVVKVGALGMLPVTMFENKVPPVACTL